MSRKRKMFNVKERCRICLVDDGCMTNLFSENLQSLVNDLAKCTSINIKNEHDLPKMICHVCLYKLDIWNEFKEQFIRSNQVLLSQLELVQNSDNTGLQSKRKYADFHHSGDDSLSDTPDKKKSKAELPSLIPLEYCNVDCITEQTTLKQIYLSDDDVTSSKDSSQKAHDVSNDNKCKIAEELGNKDEIPGKSLLAQMKAKLLTGKRGRTTEEREASTKRWVARKRALRAARGDSFSDTDSLGSDETELSPVQKARAKSNMDIEVEKQKRLVQELQKLESSLTDKHPRDDFINLASDSDTPKAISPNNISFDVILDENKSTPNKNSAEQNEVKEDKSSREDSKKQQDSLSWPGKSTTEKSSKISETQINEDTFTPCSVKSELEVGDATYIVTSTLMFAEPHYLNKTNLSNLSKELKSNHNIEQISQEKNTDIIDAVQLRRINPVPMGSSDKKCTERCLNIEVEGTEIEALKRVQVELAGFVEKEMKHRLFGTTNDDAKKSNIGNGCKSSYQTLDQQLKNIIEKTIKKNFESSIMRSCGGAEINSYIQKSGRVSPTFLKEVQNSKKYQPKVVLKRLDITKESKQRNINNKHILVKRTVKNKLGGPFSMVFHKRQSVPPIRYNDYNTSALDSDSELSDEIEISEGIKTEENHNEQQKEMAKEQGTVKPVGEPKVDSTAAISESIKMSEQKIDSQGKVSRMNSPISEKNMSGMSEQSVNSRNELVANIRTFKTESTSTLRPNKHRMMRCKRCHEIVEARFVKAHVCKSTKQQNHKCYVCNSTFRTEKLLVRHLESHDQSEFSIENITKGESLKSSQTNASQNAREAVGFKSEKSQFVKAESSGAAISDDSKTIKVLKGENAQELERPEKAYTCFVCDKIFTDEEILKDHLQKHCDDASEDDQSNGKEQYQCAICGNSLDSEEALEAHVEKHLFDEEDDNPNLINIASENDKTKHAPYHCLQCAETFNSDMLLEMHMQAHEEEAAIAEWEKQGIKAYEFQCMICDELFETEEELSEHLDIHNGNAHVCQLCDKPFSSLEDLQKHVATH